MKKRKKSFNKTSIGTNTRGKRGYLINSFIMVGYITIRIPKIKDLILINPILKEESKRVFNFFKSYKKSIIALASLSLGFYYKKDIE